MVCFRCREHEARPENIGLCDECDDAEPQAFAFCRDVIGDASDDRTTRDLLELPWRE